MTHFKTITNVNYNTQSECEAIGCGSCQTSCQSACKTSCTVANQPCERKGRSKSTAAELAQEKTAAPKK